MKISKKLLKNIIKEETQALAEAFGSNSWSAQDIADVGDKFYSDMVPKNKQVDLTSTPDIRQIMAMAAKAGSGVLSTETIINVIEQAGQQGIKLNIRDPEVWVATVQGKFSNYGAPTADDMKRRAPDLYRTFAQVRTPNLDRKFQNSISPQQSSQRGSAVRVDHPADGMSPASGQENIHQGGLEGPPGPAPSPMQQHPSNQGSVGPEAHLKRVFTVLASKDLTDPRSAELAIKVLKHVIMQLEKISQL
tara:strand:+ start:968 stop:1711 length:744 start_codon:yes stop_codon:yes gene_type:complete